MVRIAAIGVYLYRGYRLEIGEVLKVLQKTEGFNIVLEDLI